MFRESAGGVRQKTTPWLLAVILIIVFSVTWMTFEMPGMLERVRTPGSPKHVALGNEPSGTLKTLLQTLYHPSTAVNAAIFQDYAGTQWNLTKSPSWEHSLGKRLCIVDIDTRPLDNENEILDSSPLNWDSTNPLTAGMLNHYMYATIHGYDYHFIQAEKLPDRAPYWSKPMALSRILKDYDVCISIDADAIFTHLTLPFEWLLNRWGFEKGKTSLAMALDPDKSWSLDSKGRLSTNAGFVIAQNLDRTHDMLKAWSTCPDDEARYPGCAHWKNPWPAEQRAFADYIRYEYNRTTDVVEIPCTEGNGYPTSGQGCKGDFVRHFWDKKGTLLKPGVAASLAQAVIGKAHGDLLMGKDEDKIVLKDVLGDDITPIRG